MICPMCNSKETKHRSAMMERAFTIAHVDYYECEKCGHRWEPSRMVDVRLDHNGRGLLIPSGTSIRVWYGDTDMVGIVNYIDEYHFTFRGTTYHRDQFATHVTNLGLFVEPIAIRGAKKYSGFDRADARPVDRRLRTVSKGKPRNRVELDYRLKGGERRTAVIPIDYSRDTDRQIAKRRPAVQRKRESGMIEDERWYESSIPSSQVNGPIVKRKGGRR